MPGVTQQDDKEMVVGCLLSEAGLAEASTDSCPPFNTQLK